MNAYVQHLLATQQATVAKVAVGALAPALATSPVNPKLFAGAVVKIGDKFGGKPVTFVDADEQDVVEGGATLLADALAYFKFTGMDTEVAGVVSAIGQRLAVRYP